jgi:hypothetical protein
MRNSANNVMILLCWTSYPTNDNKRVQVDEALLSIDKNINKWLLTTNNKYLVL